MEKKSVFHRIFLPAAIVILVMIFSKIIYNASRSIDNWTLHQLVATVSIVFLFLSHWIGPLFANTIAYFNGASFAERIGVCMAAPVVKIAINLWDFIGVYSFGEFLFLIFHSLIIGPVFIGLLCMGVSEIGCRLIHQRKITDSGVRILALNNVAVLGIGFSMTALMLYSGGHFYFHNIFSVVYTAIFS